MNPNTVLILGGLFTLLSLPAFASPSDYGDGIEPYTPSRLLENSDGKFNRWNGIGRLESRGNRLCTAVLINTHTPGSDQADSPAYLLSNAHCAYTTAGRIGVDLEIEGHVEFNYFKDTANNRKVYPLKRLTWSSLQGMDLALLELDAPLSELLKDGIEPLRLTDALPEANSNILSVSAPVTATGYTLRLSACTLEAVAHIIEHPYAWTNNLKNTCMDVLPGSSGSPILDRTSNQIIGIMGTTTRNSSEESRCFTDAPCEVKAGQATWVSDTNYGSPTHHLNSCFADGKFDLSLKACALSPDFTVTLHNPNYLNHYFRIRQDEQGNPIAPRWNLRFSIDTSHFYFKTVRDPMECRDPHRYSSSTHAQSAFIDSPIGTEAGMYMLCVIGVNGAQERVTPGLLNNAYIQTAELVEDAPTPVSNITVTPAGTKQHISFNYVMPSNVGYAYKFGSPDVIDCDDRKGYKTANYNFNISQRLLPVKLCTYAKDAAGEQSEPRTDLIARSED
jgi:V8-like Glu-specific endopeptidase